MAEILDVIQKITFDVQGDTELSKAVTSINNQVKAVGVLSTRLESLQRAFNATAANEIDKRQRIQGLINKQNQAIQTTIGNIGKEVQANKQLQDVITREIGLINTLTLRQKALTEERNKSSDVKQIQAYNKELQKTQGELTKLTQTSKGSGIGQSVLQGLGLAGGLGIAGLVAGGVSAASGFVSESSDIAAQVEGVQRAFSRLNDPNLLNNLRDATKGTVSDLELMKQAVQFSNFGLPIEKLGVALEFARRRAADTGQSVDFLVQSIVTGIGRQSPLILDNLGINAKRVADEFQRTGDFAEAAFKIISEESAKAGKDLETFAEQQARINANIENAQAGFGKVFNQLQGFGFSILQDIFSGSGNQFQQAYADAIKAAESGQRELEQINNNAQILYERSFQDFANKYARADYSNRDVIKKQAKDMFDFLYKQGTTFYANDLDQQQFYLRSLQQAYQSFNKQVTTTRINLQKITTGDIAGFTREQLEALQEQINNARTSLTAADTTEIARLNKLSDAVKKYRDTIDGVKPKLDKTADSQRKLREELDLFARSLFRLDKEDFDKYIKEVEDELKRRQDGLLGVTDTFKAINPDNNSGLFGFDNGRPESEAVGIRQQIRDQQSLDKIKRDNDEAEKKRISELREMRNNAKEDFIQGIYQGIAAINRLLDAQIDAIDTEISVRENRIEQATKLAEQGNTAILESETKRLDELQSIRTQKAQAQIQLNALVEASNQAVAVSEAIGAITAAAAKGDPYTIALRIAAAVAALVAGIATIKGAFKDGVVDFQGEGDGRSDSNVVRISHGESVLTAAATKNNRGILEAMNNGAKFNMVGNVLVPNVKTATVSANAKAYDYQRLEKKLDGVIEAVSLNSTTVNTKMDQEGIRQLVIKQQRRAHTIHR